MDMQRSIAALLLALGAGCASDVDLQLDRDAEASSSIGVLRSTRLLGGAGHSRVVGVAWHPNSLFVIGGYFDGTTDLGEGPAPANGYGMGFVAAYDALTGEPVWTHPFSGSTATDASYHLTSSAVIDVAVAASGTVYAVGSFGRTIDFGSGPIESTDGCDDGFIARYAADGTALTPFILSQASLYGVATTPDGGVVTTGYEVVSECPWRQGGNAPINWFVAALDPTGQIRWKVDLGETATVEGVATSSEGDVLVRGGLMGQLHLGDDSVSAVHSHGSDSFVGRFSPEGQPRWLTSCGRSADGSSCNDFGTVSFSSTGRPFTIETFRRRVDLAGTIMETSAPNTDLSAAYVAELGEDGEPVNSIILDGMVGRAIVVRDDPFEIIVSGDGNPDSEAAGPYVGILANGTTLVSQRGMSIPPFSWGQAWDIAVGPAGELAVVGAFHGQADFGDGPVHAETDDQDEGNDGFLAIYQREVVESVR